MSCGVWPRAGPARNGTNVSTPWSPTPAPRGGCRRAGRFRHTATGRECSGRSPPRIPLLMRIAYTDQQEALRQELRAYYDELLTPEVREGLAKSEGIGPAMRAVVRQMGKDRWLGVGWPEEFGGRGFGPVEQFVFFDESMRAGAPVPMLTINTVGP